MICGLTVLSLGCFIAEAVILGYVPLFLRGVPHAYSEFHLTGIHYFTVSCVLVPSLTVLYVHMRNGRGSEKLLIAALVATAISC